MQITFVLPAPVRVPTGGAAVVFRHAEGLSARGHDVRVVLPRRIPGERGRFVAAAVALRDRWQGVAAAAPFTSERVEIRRPRVLGADDLIGDAVIATGIQTVDLTAAQKQRGWWFVQGDETFVRPDARDAWHLGLGMIPCSRWLAREIETAGVPVAGIVPNAVDTILFGLDTAPLERTESVLALYHRHEVKGPQTLLSVYAELRRRRPNIQLVLFAARTPNHRIPPDVEVIVRPDAHRLRELYNQAAVFLHTSRLEGWALTPMEAAACGAAVVSTASRGPAEYLEAGRSMNETDVGDVDALVAATLDLLDHPGRRARQAEEALHDVSRFSWDASTDRLEQILVAGRPR